MCVRRFNWSQMLAVVRLSTSLHTQELLNRAQFAGDRNWQIETRVTERLTEGQQAAPGNPARTVC
jgi:hypothetical protein